MPGFAQSTAPRGMGYDDGSSGAPGTVYLLMCDAFSARLRSLIYLETLEQCVYLVLLTPNRG